MKQIDFKRASGMIKFYTGVFFIFFSGSAIAAEIKTVTEDVVYYNNGKDVKGYLAGPDDNQKHKGIILIHEWWGLNDNIRVNARKFAKLGYVALAVDLYEGESTTNREEARKLATRVRQNMEEAFKNLKSAVSYVKNQANRISQS